MSDGPVISLFSGAGGMSLGFAQAGVKPVFAADNDGDACATYRANLDIDAVEADISQPEPFFRRAIERYGRPFALIGGPPCQGFSSAGRKDGQDGRNRLIFEYLSIFARLSPRWFLFENVEGLLTSHGGSSLCSLVGSFIGLGYRLRLEKINFAAFGLPQGRKRVVLVGNRLGIDFTFPQATHSFNAGKHKQINGLPPAPSLNDAFAGLGPAGREWAQPGSYETATPMNAYDASMRQENHAATITLHGASISPQLADIVHRLRPGETMKDLPPEHWHDSYERRAFRRVMDGTPTEKRGGAPSGVKRLVGTLNALTVTGAATREFIHPTEDRPLTLRECARLQSFPDRYAFTGRAMSVARQIGNAFPPLAARVFADHLMRLDGAFGADVSAPGSGSGALIGFRLTEATGMSPALARTHARLHEIAASPAQPAPPRETALTSAA